MTTPGWQRVRFIGYAIPTAPAQMVPLGSPGGGGSLGGTYLGLPDAESDIAGRLGILRAAVHAAREALPDDDEGVLNVFAVPEFFWHGPQGPYLFGTGETDPVDHLQTLLEREFPADEYADWLFLFGTAITAQADDPREVFSRATTLVRNGVVADLAARYRRASGEDQVKVFDMVEDYLEWGHAHPVLQVRNRALLMGGAPLGTPRGAFGGRVATTEKYVDSGEDFVLWDTTGRADVVTEQMIAHAFIDLSAGDLKRRADDAHAIARLAPDAAAPVDVGVEICLDHTDARLRQGLPRNRWPRDAGDGIELQLVPSCGAALRAASVAVAAGGYAFNVDGQFVVGDGFSPTGAGPVFGVASAWGNHVAPANPRYQAHTQLARVDRPASGGDAKSPSSTTATFERLTADDVAVVGVPLRAMTDTFFAGGGGAVHIYGLREALPLSSS
ncbi:hypothetical protein M4I32_03550 [Microbacterium sp. LRZ72]|uniref:hypothetical protein n=1 Tax=Microbacterium sp. LRZ72 TaxID=2942481 RepID=UPI0029B91AC5|nr:hypothetical protein [Microbacterium sp. LRZ72]MDX2375871.1 hypothetical protein [Microbacterium sp. LRZ72]